MKALLMFYALIYSSFVFSADFMKSVKEGAVIAVQNYLKEGAEPYTSQDDQTAIDLAISGNNLFIRDLLVNYEYEDGDTPLIRAIRDGNTSEVLKLLDNNAKFSLFTKDGASLFKIIDQLPEGKDIKYAMIKELIKIKDTDGDGCYINTKKLLGIRPNESVECKDDKAAEDRTFILSEFSTPGYRQYSLNNLKRHKLGNAPSAPVFHKYDGNALYVLDVKLPDSFNTRIPEKIKSELIKHDIQKLDLYFVVQQFERDYLFRPHYWIQPDIPETFKGVLMSRYVWAGLFEPSVSIEQDLKNEKLELFEFILHDGRISPRNARVGLSTDPMYVWTLTIDNTLKDKPKKAAVTLHWLLPFEKAKDFGRRITGGVIEGYNYGNPAKSLQALWDKLNSGLLSDYEDLLPSFKQLLF